MSPIDDEREEAFNLILIWFNGTSAYMGHISYCHSDNLDARTFAQHLQQNHADEEDVIKIFKCAKGSKARKDELAKLRYSINFKRNIEVLQAKKGNLKVLRRPRDMVSATE